MAVLLHWAIAALILFNLALGPFMEGFTQKWRMVAVPLHVSAGFSVLALTLVRIGWRATHHPPPLPAGPAWERLSATVVHLLLYGLMLYLPLTGWALISANPPPDLPGANPYRGRPPVIWGLFELPLMSLLQDIGATAQGLQRQKQIHDGLVSAHAAGGFTLMGLAALHVLGALKHQWWDGHRELQRMSLDLRKRR